MGGRAKNVERKSIMTNTFTLTIPLYAGLLGLLAAALTANVIAARVRNGVDNGDGGVARVAQAIRAHANFVEQAPIALILIGVAALLSAPIILVHGLGATLIAARSASAIALNRSLGQSPLRQFGGGVSVLLVAVAAATDLWLWFIR
jgi:uncharacterized membrane protein YecN with MAPEG domain